MSSGPLELHEARAAYVGRWDAVEAVKARELAALTDERAWQIIRTLAAAELWRARPDWSGLVEQQALLHSKRSS
jgi:hypothetical protein